MNPRVRVRVPCQHCQRRMWRRLKRPNGKAASRYSCNPCKRKLRKARIAEWRQTHKEETRAYYRRWASQHEEARRAYQERWRDEHRDRVREIGRRASRRRYRKTKKELEEVIASIPCLECGMKHTPERRAAILRRMLPTSVQEIREAWTCIWGHPSEHSTAGEMLLYRDLRDLGASSRSGTYALREVA